MPSMDGYLFIDANPSSPHDPKETAPHKPFFTAQTVRKLGCINERKYGLRDGEKNFAT